MVCANCGRPIKPCDFNPRGEPDGDRCGIGFVHVDTGEHYCVMPPPAPRWQHWATPPARAR